MKEAVRLAVAEINKNNESKMDELRSSYEARLQEMRKQHSNQIVDANEKFNRVLDILQTVLNQAPAERKFDVAGVVASGSGLVPDEGEGQL